MVTFQEPIDMVHQAEKERHRAIYIYPETKHPSFFRKIGLPLEDRMLEVLERNGYKGKEAHCFIQSFEVANLKALRPRTQLRLMQLIDEVGAPQDFVESGDKRTFADLITPQGLAEIAKYADGVAVSKKLLIPLTADGHLGQPTPLIAEAHRLGLLVHGWTYRAENQYLPVEFRKGDDPEGLGDLAGETQRFFEAGIDGMFSNHPDLAVKGRQQSNLSR
jgi:glycerophosphoryl diester phosphodiesterase